jgi:WD40 repeat protein
MIFQSIKLILLVHCIKIVASNEQIISQITQKDYKVSCNSFQCQNVINRCVETLSCLGPVQCKRCVVSQVECNTTCGIDLFNETNYELVNGKLYLECSDEDAKQRNACRLVCRGKYLTFSKCQIYENHSICQCASKPFTTTKMTTTEELLTTTIESLSNKWTTVTTTRQPSNTDWPIWTTTTRQPPNTDWPSWTTTTRQPLSTSINQQSTIWPWSSQRPSTYQTTTTSSVGTNIHLLNTMYVYGESVRSLALTPYGSYLASGGTQRTIRLWNIYSFYEEWALYGHSDTITCMASISSSDNNYYFASGADDMSVRIWNVWSGSQMIGVSAHSAPIRALATLSDAYFATAGGSDYSIKIWTIRDQVMRHEKTLLGHLSHVNALASLDWGFMASGSYDTTIRVWSWQYNDTSTLTMYNSEAVLCLQVMRNGSLASGGLHGSINLWNPRTGVLLRTLYHGRGWLTALALLHNGDLVSGNYAGSIVIWDKNTLVAKGFLFEAHQGPVYSLLALDNQRFVSAGDNYIKVSLISFFFLLLFNN